MDLTFLTASVQLQLALGAGYLGYVTAYGGLRSHHQQIDVAFLTVAFGLVATFASPFASKYLPGPWAFAACIAASILAGILWRVFGRNWIRKLMRSSRISYVDDDPSVLSTIFADRAHNVSQVQVTIEGGHRLACNDLSRFGDAAIRPFMVAQDGSVAMYVTHTYRRAEDGSVKETEQKRVRDPIWGDNMTILPAESVKKLDIRFVRKSFTHPEGEAEVAEAAER